jgi:hypothetical protein
VPEVGAAVESIRPLPVLAAGGIVTGRQIASAVWLGAVGAWTGSVWLTTEEGRDRSGAGSQDAGREQREHLAVHRTALRKPLDSTEFVDELREEMRAELDALHAALPRYDWLTIFDRASGAITLTPLAAAPEPRNLRRLKQAVHTR